MKKSKRKKIRKPKKHPLLPGVIRTPEEKLAAYRILRSGIRAKVAGRRILEDTTADLSKYEDTREPQVPGKTIRNPFKAYPWRPSSYDTVKG